MPLREQVHVALASSRDDNGDISTPGRLGPSVWRGKIVIKLHNASENALHKNMK